MYPWLALALLLVVILVGWLHLAPEVNEDRCPSPWLLYRGRQCGGPCTELRPLPCQRPVAGRRP